MTARPSIPRLLTTRGAATRTRIVQAAASLIYAQGARGTSLEEVMHSSGASKSQLYHYFANKDALLQAVVALQTSRVMQAQAPHIGQLDSMGAITRWRDAVVALAEAHAGPGGCPIGSLASELADHSEGARELLVQAFQAWEAHLANGLRAMRGRGELSASADPADLATSAICALQGGLLLAQTYRTARPVRVALDMALGNIARHLAPAARPA